jgi:hypothetical protein
MRGRGAARQHDPGDDGDQEVAARQSSAPDVPRAASAGRKLPKRQQRFPERFTAFEIAEYPPDEDWLIECSMQSIG